MLSHDELLTALHYDPATGTFRWKRSQGRCREGAVAGTIKPDNGYRQISINSRLYFAHRLAWFYMHGVWPVEVDHRNGRRDDNRAANLREASRVENCRNMRSNRPSKTGTRGVYLQASTGRYYAQVRIGDGRRVNLGTFDTREEARAARVAACQRFHGEFASPHDCT